MSNQLVLKSLVLVNFKRHKALHVEFAKELTVVRGANYAGKSSLLEGILYSYGGATLVPGGREVIVNDEAKDCNVTHTFELNGESYVISRSFKDAVVSYGGEVKATGHTGVNAFLEQKFGMPIKDL